MVRLSLGAGLLLLTLGTPLSAQSPATGTIINDPSGLDWDYYGSNYKLKPIRDPSFPGGGAAVEIDVEKGEHPYAAGANIQLSGPIVAGRDYTVRFWARTLSTTSPDGKGRVVVRFMKNAEPYPGFGETVIVIGADWTAYEVTAKADQNISSQGAVALQLASVKQRIQIGQAIVAEGRTIAATKVSASAESIMPPQLAGKGELLNDPLNRNWVVYGKFQTATPTSTDVYTRRAVLLSVSAAGTNSWDAGVNAPIREAIAEGDVLRVSLLARSSSAATGDGQGLVRLRVQSNRPPYDGFGAQEVKLGPSWKLIQWRIQAAMDLPAGRGEIAIHTGLAKQDVEIGPVYVIREPAPVP